MMEPIAELKTRLKKIATLESILSLLEWDQQVNLPQGSYGMRSIQMSSITEMIHKENTSKSLGELIHSIAGGTLLEDEKIVVEEAQKKYNRLIRIPEAFASRKAESQSESYQKWAEARKTGDFSIFAPHLKQQIEFAKEEATYVGSHDSAYAYLIDQFDPGMDTATIDTLFKPLAVGVSDLLNELSEKLEQSEVPELKGFHIGTQKTFLTEVIRRLGFDFDHGRIDESVHPFCLGNGQDIRMTTRFFEDNPIDSIYSSIHETGHALYEQGLSEQEFGNALGSYAGMAAHESQSRLWENQVARSEAFWRFWEKRYRKLFPTAMAGISLEQWMRKILEIKCIPIRFDSDEVTYNLHIFIRYELEKALFDGSLRVDELPGAWNDLYEKYLGIRAVNDSEGVLQDVHWSGGAFGYFPSYTLGNIVSAQLWETLNSAHPDLGSEIENGEYGTILTWLRQNIHAHGRKYTTQELVRVATGQTLSEQPLLNYLKNKYFGFYGIDPMN